MTKKILKLFLLIATFFTGVATINADSAPSNLTITNYTIGSEPIIFPDTTLNNTVNFHVKKTSSGEYVYCVHYAKKPPISSIGYTKLSKITDNGINYILAGGRNAENDTDFFKYQTALWIYLVETNQMEGTHNDINRFIKTIASNNDSLSREIRAIVNQAKSGDTYHSALPTLKITSNNVKFTLKDGYYVSSKIEVDSNTGKFDAELTNAPSGSKIDKHSDYFIVKIPESSVTKTTTVEYKVTNTKSVYTSYYYAPSYSNYQKMAYTDKTRHYGSDKGKATLTIKEKEPVITKIVKVDAETGTILKGATLQITNSNGKIIDTWTTTGESHELKNLAAGTYTLTEVSAPEGYEKSNEKVVFKIDSNGKLTNENGKIIDKVTFTNKKIEKPTGVKISKQDITNKQELPGATLVIKDKEGNVVKEFISKNEPTYFELKPGDYTLTEKIAPNGYVLSTETIKFTVKEDGTIDTVVMYNTPEEKTTGVNISKQDITNKQELPGATLVIKDYDGNIVKEFISENKPTYFELKPGIYTLTETVAPEGYILSSETITFTVKEDGTIDTVVMYNTPNSKEVVVENTASTKTITSTVIGLIVSVLGLSLIYKKPKKLV